MKASIVKRYKPPRKQIERHPIFMDHQDSILSMAILSKATYDIQGGPHQNSKEILHRNRKIIILKFIYKNIKKLISQRSLEKKRREEGYYSTLS